MQNMLLVAGELFRSTLEIITNTKIKEIKEISWRQYSLPMVLAGLDLRSI